MAGSSVPLDTSSRIFVAGHAGFVGAAICAHLGAGGYKQVITADREALDLRNAGAVEDFFRSERPEYVVMAAGRSGGIAVNRARPGEFIHDNLAMQLAVLDAARAVGTQRLAFFACSCVYPREARQPMRETDLLTGPLEKTSEAFALAKLAGLKMVEAYNRQYGCRFASVIPASVYGPGDDFDPETSHVLSALVRKFSEARADGRPVVVWGTGAPRREFIYVEDLADACLFLLTLADDAWTSVVMSPYSTINVGAGADIPIRDLAGLVQAATGHAGEIVFDTAAPDGAPRKLLDSGRIAALGWTPRTDLKSGIQHTYRWYTSSDVRR